MKVKVLKALLKDMPDNYEVVHSRDEEGNGFAPIEYVGVGRYDKGGDFHDPEEEVGRNNAICLWP